MTWAEGSRNASSGIPTYPQVPLPFCFCRKYSLAKHPSYQLDQVEFLLTPESVKLPVTSSYGNQWVPCPLTTAKPSSHHAWWSTLFLNESPTWPCVVCSGLVPRLSIHKCAMVSFIRPVPRKMATMVCVLIPDTNPSSQWGQQETITRVTRFDLCFKGILGK